ncbi:MFS family permease [Lederbergia galactosidilyticus]|uniref:MFS transporter n=1 Tax=Lederbergia galactosidilytica TaxID=217031 RepID=UPI001AE1453D|nr:MFS transporter [Lederbergia galactosidilytica]MBP1917130.1 MFS family permease [Lederbergia galactosidilytica]
MGIFKYRNFSLMFFGRMISNIGDSLYGVAAMLLIFQLGGSTFYTGLAGFLSILPRIVEFSAGPLIDRIPIRSLLIRTQLIQSGLLLVIPLAYYLDYLSVALVLILTPIISVFNVLIFPAQLAALPEVLPEEKLTKGNSLFTIAYQGVDITFNGLAGILFVVIGPFSLYMVNSIAFLIGAMIFSFIRLPNRSVAKVETEKTIRKKGFKTTMQNYIQDLQEGITTMFKSFIAKLLYGAIILNLVSAATLAVFPAFGEVIGGAQYVGFLLMASAFGSLSGALIAPLLKLEQIPIGKLYAFGYLISGSLWTLSALMPVAWLTLVLYMISWIPAGALNVLVFTMLQKIAPKHLIGRIITAATSLSAMAAPVGSLLGGSVGAWIGSVLVVICSGITVLIVAICWLINTEVRNLPPTKSLDENSLVIQREG